MLAELSTYFIDLDGVIYRGEKLLPGAKEFIQWLDTHKKKYLFLTNNSFASEIQVVEKLQRLGIETDKTHVLGAGQAAIQSIAHRLPEANVYVVGEEPLRNLVRAHGLKVVDQTTEKVDAVLVGLDRNFNYAKITSAVQAIRAGAIFVAINRDPLLPIVGDMIPGCGAMVAAIEAASSVKPEVVGKPEPTLLREALLTLNSQKEETVMIGDGLDTDIQAGKAAGTRTLLVFSGKDSREDLARSAIKPDYTYENLAELLNSLN